MLENLYEICFWVGAGWFGLTFLLGELGDGIDEFDLAGFHPAWLPGFRSFLVGVLIFGACGMWLSQTQSGGVTVISSILVGILFICAFEFGVYRPLKRAESTSSISKKELIGHEATVTLTIHPGKHGQVKVVYAGGSLSYAALSDSAEVLALHEKVVIVRLEGESVVVAKPDVTHD